MKLNSVGVSETIGFVLILGIVITGIGLVTLYGYPALLEQQQNANVKNMEKNMIVLQNDIKLLAYKSVPYRETTMQISGGTLEVINPTIDPDMPGSSNFKIFLNGSPTPKYQFYTGLLQYTSNSNNAIIGLQNGAVVTNGFDQTGHGSSMLSDPRWFLDTDLSNRRTLVVSMINITSGESVSSSSGIGTVQMNISAGTPIEELTPASVAIQYLNEEEGYRQAWVNYFNNQQVFPGSSVTGATLNFNNIDRLVVKTYNVTVLNL